MDLELIKSNDENTIYLNYWDSIHGDDVCLTIVKEPLHCNGFVVYQSFYDNETEDTVQNPVNLAEILFNLAGRDNG